jgi:hypothetical protein
LPCVPSWPANDSRRHYKNLFCSGDVSRFFARDHLAIGDH